MKRKTKPTKAFSLVEVIVVIAIILILASLAFTVFGRSKSRSLETVSASNLKQYHHALHLYAADHGAMPVGRPHHPELIRYLGGKWIDPPLALPSEQRAHKWDGTYRVTAFRDSPGFPKLLQDCFDKRQGSIAIVTDPNWATPEQVALTKGGFYLYVRMDGSIGKETGDFNDRYARYPEQFPCPGAPQWANYR